MAIEAQRIATTQRHIEQNRLDARIGFNNGQSLFLDSHAAFVFGGARPLGESAARTGGAVQSAMVAMTATGPQRLCRSPE